MTPNAHPNDPDALEAPRSVQPRWWLLAAGLLAIGAALGWRVWNERKPTDPPMLPGQPPPPALVQREEQIRQLADHALANRAQPDETAIHPVTPVPKNAQPDLSAFRIAEDHRTYDLRAWKPVEPGNGPHTAAVVMKRRLKLTKLAAADRIDFLTRTSGADLVVRLEEPRPEAAKVFASQNKPIVSGKEMVEQRLSADVSHVKIGDAFELVYRTTYWNSLQTPEEQWFGTIGYDGSTLLSILILFPESRPFGGGGLRNGPADGELLPYDGTQMVFKGTGGTWMYWEVPGPKTGHIYRVDWRW
jgi:eukaryotic-like serine/threonine-protein kinase